MYRKKYSRLMESIKTNKVDRSFNYVTVVFFGTLATKLGTVVSVGSSVNPE